MRKIYWAISLIILIGCKQKKIDLSGNETLTARDFFDAFQPINLPLNIADSNITAVSDTTSIGYNAIKQFIPDSFLNKYIISKNTVIHSIGSITKPKEIYLLANFSTGKKTTLLVFVFDAKNKFLGIKQLLSNTNPNRDYVNSLLINKEPTFLISQEKYDANKQLHFSRTGWVFNSNTKNFMVVINDGNEDPKRDIIINPIDTLPKKNKWSGNYIKDKKNFIALRDGRDNKSYNFFIHFEKVEENCSGELKGVLKFIDATHAIYNEGGDPCIIDFLLEGITISVKEKGSCGNRRGMNCFFNDSYERKKETTKKKPK
jgi:hypothetical protein